MNKKKKWKKEICKLVCWVKEVILYKFICRKSELNLYWLKVCNYGNNFGGGGGGDYGEIFLWGSVNL